MLGRSQYRSLVGKQEVTDYRIGQEYQVQDVDIDGVRRIALDQFVQERQEAQADNQDDRADDAVNLAVKVQQGANGIVVALGHRLVHAEDHRAADAQLGESQHVQDGGKEAVQTQVLGAEGIDNRRPGQERQQQHHDAVEHASQDILFGIYYSGFSHNVLYTPYDPLR